MAWWQIILLVIAGAGIVSIFSYFLFRFSSATDRARLDELKQQLKDIQAENEKLRQELINAHQERILAQKGLEEQKAFLEQAKAKLADTFKSLASEVLSLSSKDFLTLAEEKFKALKSQSAQDLEARKQAIEELVKPLSQLLNEYKRDVNKLDQKIEELGKVQTSLQIETSRLVNVLKNPGARGKWGELSLRRVVELAGLVPYCDFFEQRQEEIELGKIRPDMIVRLPGGKEIPVDAKVPGDKFFKALEVDSEQEKEQLLNDYANDVKKRVDELASRKYFQLEQSPDFVVFFIPNESLLSTALERKPDLMEYAFDKKVVIATPATLIALLKAVAYGWRQQEVAETAKRIYELGRELCERVAIISEHLAGIGRGLNLAVESYNSAVGSLESRLLVSARRFKELARYEREIQELSPVDQRLRPLAPPEEDD